jgi:hypothetical protein
MDGNFISTIKRVVLICADQQGRFPVNPRKKPTWYWDLSKTGRGMETIQEGAEERRKKPFVDMRLPLYWLLSAIIALGGGIFAVGNQFSTISSKMDTILVSAAELKAQSKDQSDKYQALRDSQMTMQFTMQHTIDLLAAQVSEIQRTLGKKP